MNIIIIYINNKEMKFCTKQGCGNILTPNFKNNNLTFNCETCYNVFESTAEDTLLIDNYLKEDDSLYKHQIYLNNAHDDILTNLIKKNVKIIIVMRQLLE